MILYNFKLNLSNPINNSSPFKAASRHARNDVFAEQNVWPQPLRLPLGTHTESRLMS